MIRKLRWKFVAVCMGLVALVLCGGVRRRLSRRPAEY